MRTELPPSELVVAHALHSSLPAFLAAGPADIILAQFLRDILFSQRDHVRQPRAA
jgi:hypothetical protein